MRHFRERGFVPMIVGRNRADLKASGAGLPSPCFTGTCSSRKSLNDRRDPVTYTRKKNQPITLVWKSWTCLVSDATPARFHHGQTQHDHLAGGGGGMTRLMEKNIEFKAEHQSAQRLELAKPGRKMYERCSAYWDNKHPSHWKAVFSFCESPI